MRRRQFLRGLGTIAAGAAVGLRGSSARGSELSAFLPAYQAARSRGRPLLLTTVLSVDDERTFESAREAIQKGPDHELAVRLLLIEIYFTADRESVLLLTKDQPKAEPPALALIDGEQPRMLREAQLETAHLQKGLERFLRAAIPLTAAWLAPRVALLSVSNGDVVKRLRRQIARGQLPGAVGQLAPAVVVLEALKRKRVRDRLLADLLAPPAPPRVHFADPPEELDVPMECGLGAQLVNPLGTRFADAFTKRRNGLGRNHAAT